MCIYVRFVDPTAGRRVVQRRRGLRLTRVPGDPRGTVDGPRTEARPLRVIRRHFLLQGCDYVWAASVTVPRPTKSC